MDSNLKRLMDTVVQNDYCIGCGTCASIEGSPLKMELDENGKYQPFLKVDSSKNDVLNINPLSVCPFSDYSKDETEIGKDIFGTVNGTTYNKYTGYYIKNFAGYVKEGNFRNNGSSGGMGNWIAAKLLRNKMVDGIIHVKSTGKKDVLFEYQISYSEDELSHGAKSKYYPIELSNVIRLVKENNGKYALIGIPCFIKSIRLLAEKDEIVKNRIKYFIGLVCGHLKSNFFAKSISWELGIKPENLKDINFRKKLIGRQANDYGVEVVGEQDGTEVIISSPTRELYTTNWGHGLFKYNACEFCDDVLAETADVTVGDAWLPEYSKDSLGTNILTVRNPKIQELFEENKHELYLEEISLEKIYQSQAGGFRHRRDGLAYRLFLKDMKDEWRPKKRVKADNSVSTKRKHLYEKRTSLSQKSFVAYKIALKEGNFNAFKNFMDPEIKEYNKLIAPSIVKRVLRKIKKKVKRFARN